MWMTLGGGLNRGLKFQPEVEKLIYDPAYEEMHKDLTDQKYTSLILKKSMNSIAYDMIFVT